MKFWGGGTHLPGSVTPAARGPRAAAGPESILATGSGGVMKVHFDIWTTGQQLENSHQGLIRPHPSEADRLRWHGGVSLKRQVLHLEVKVILLWSKDKSASRLKGSFLFTLFIHYVFLTFVSIFIYTRYNNPWALTLLCPASSLRWTWISTFRERACGLASALTRLLVSLPARLHLRLRLPPVAQIAPWWLPDTLEEAL